MMIAETYLLAGQSDAAERELRVGYDRLQETGEKAYLSSITALLAFVCCAIGRYDEAERYVAEARELGAPDDLTTQLYAGCAEAEILASRDSIDDALLTIRDTQHLIDPTDYLTDRGAALRTRAKVERTAGNLDRAREALTGAIELFERKGYVTAVDDTRRLIAEL